MTEPSPPSAEAGPSADGSAAEADVDPLVPPSAPQFLADVVAGLSGRLRSVPSKYFYDERGSELFDAITRLDAYYPTRTERAILEAHADSLVDAIGKGSALVEYGSGSSDKTRILLDALHARRTLAAYVPIDISEDYLLATAERLRAAYPGLPVLPVAADYTRPFALPDLPPETARRVVFFPGSTIGNFTPAEAEDFLRGARDVAGRGGAVLLGVDQKKDAAVLEAAYDDPEGVTAAFNLNLLARMNRELGADADPDAWAHEARWNEDEGRVEMHLRSLRGQTLRVGGRAFSFRAGETVHTENSYKYGPDGLARVAARAGLRRADRWTDPREWFAVELYTP